MAHQFLSNGWLDEVKKMSEPLDTLSALVLNLKVVDGPEGDVELHLADLNFDKGFVDEAETTIVLTYDTAKRLMTEEEGDMQQMLMQSVMSGDVEVQGDLASLLNMAGPLGDSGISTEDQQQLLGIMRKRMSAFTL